MIEFVYFDVGGVVIKDFSGTKKWDELRTELGITPTNKGKFDELWGAHSDEHSTTFDVDDLVPALRKELHLKLPKDYSLLMGFVNRFEKNEELWPVLSAMKREVPIGLLTNMYPRMMGRILAAGLFPPIDWDVIVDSSVERMAKPNAAIYKLAEEKAKVDVDKVLFVDNSQAHLNVAKNRGWQTFLFDPVKNRESCDGLLKYFNMNK
jgi:FMN phosphatase YigB (HAD superfamily)